MRLILALVLLVALGGCSSQKDSPKAEPSRAPSTTGSPTPSTPDASGTKACAEVRAGIDAFNALDFQGTVDHFKLALPLARAQARTDSSKAADDLVEAVSYYARLAPDDYPASARSSLRFAKYKAITLGQCVTRTAPLQEEPSKSPGVTT